LRFLILIALVFLGLLFVFDTFFLFASAFFNHF